MTDPAKKVKPGIINDVFGQLLETGKQTAKAAKQQLKPQQLLQTASSQLGVKPEKAGQSVSNLDPSQQIEGVPVTQLSEAQFAQIKKQRQLQTLRRYQEIQQALQQYRQQRNQERAAAAQAEQVEQQQATSQAGPGPLVEPVSRKRRGMALGRGPSRQQKQHQGTGELARGKTG